MSGGRPVGALNLSWQDPSGLYAGVSGSAVFTRDEKIEPFAAQADVGYVKRLSSAASLDVGIVHSNYARYSTYNYGVSYTEVYAGLLTDKISGRLYYSPHYFEDGFATLYGELNGGLPVGRRWRLSAHVGGLAYVRQPYWSNEKTQFDWRVGAARDIGRLNLDLNLSGGGPARDYYSGRTHNRTALVLGATWIL